MQIPFFLRSLLRTFAGNPPIVLFCHRILPPKSKFSRLDEFYHCLGHPTVREFEAQIRYLTKHHSVVSLEEVLGYIMGDKILSPNPVAITFDDGYHDNYAFTFPVLEEYRSTASFFLCTDFIDTGKIPFHDQIIYSLCYTSREKVEIEDESGRACEYLLNTFDERIKSFLEIQELFKKMLYRRRETFVKKLLVSLEMETDKMPSRDFMLSWEEIKTMHLSGHSFYCHSQSHPMLTDLEDAELKKEVLESRDVISEKLSVAGNIFCYPYGKKGEFDQRIKHFLKGNGFSGACSAIHGLNKQGDDPYCIKRTAMISEPIEKFALRTAGLFEILKELQYRWR